MDGASVGFASVGKAYRTGAGLPVRALAGVTLDIPAGQAVAVTGRSGSGKSTLLHLAGALDAPDTGTITANGHDLGTLSDLLFALHRDRGLTLILATHDPAVAARCDRGIELSDGMITRDSAAAADPSAAKG
jgi:ABC-type lipoprotein export system ATPase subunit